MIPRRLAQFVPTTTEVGYFTAGAKMLVKNIVVANSGASPVPFFLSFVPSGESAGIGNRVIPGAPIPALGTVALDLTQVIEAGDVISAKAGADNALSVTISGLEV